MGKKKILIYNDSPIFGGHEIMTVHLANVLSERYQVFFLFFNNEINSLLNNQVKTRKINIVSPIPLGGIRSLFSRDLFTLKRMIRDISPDISIISQGTIELSLKGALASKWNSIKTISYIPLCFSFKKMKIGLGRFRDFLNKNFYKLFDGFITVSDEQRNLIMKQNSKVRICVLPNFVDVRSDVLQINSKDILFRREKIFRIGVVGRIHFKQKGQNKLIEIAETLRKKNMEFKIVVIGDGPDRNNLQSMVTLKKLEKFFVFTGWLRDRHFIYNQIDLLLITSNYEGMPLNMLEAIAFHKPVIAPNFGVFKEYLPSVFLYTTPEDVYERIRKFLCEKELVRERISLIRKKLIWLHSKHNFKKIAFETIENFL